MSIETYQFNLPITPGSIPPVLHLSQYDSGRTFTAVLRDDQGVPFELASSSTAVIKGRNAAGIAWQQDCTVSGANVTFTPSGAATDQFGVMPVTIEITESEEVISPLCVIFNIQKAGYTNEEAVLSPDFETAIQAAVAQAIAEGGLGFSDEFKEALLACFNGVAWATTGGQALVDDLEAALYPDVQLSSITAAYEQDRPIYYNISTIDDVKLDLVVTAHYSDGSDFVVDDYTLSGDLNVGTDTITVTYGGKTDTISVVVTEKWVYSISDLTKVTGTLAAEDAATCKMLLSKSGSNNNYRRSFMMGRGATSVAIANSGTTIVSQTSDYYPIKIPAGATKVTISITPSTQYLQVLSRTLTDGVYSTLSTSSGWSGYQQSGGTKVFSAAVGDNGYIFVTSKYNSAGSSYPTEPSALDITFSDE